MTSKTQPAYNSAPDGTAFYTYGDHQNEAIILIHGLGLCSDIWNPFIDTLSANYYVISYDLYGHGKSKPSAQKGSLTLYATQIAELMTHLNISSAHIIGFSIGGMINRRLAMNYPEKTLSLCILNSPHNRGEEAQIAVETRAKKAAESGSSATLEEALKRWFTPHYLETAHIVQNVREWRQTTHSLSYADTSWVLANGVRELIAPDIVINKPTLVMTCENDVGSTPDMSMEICDEIKGSKLIIIPELKHLGLMEKPHIFLDEIVCFLNNLNKA